jgi:uncharacterized membrane protein YfcA
MKKHIVRFVTGAASAAVIPPSVGIMDWRIIAGAAAAGGVCGLFGVNLAQRVKNAATRKAPP